MGNKVTIGPGVFLIAALMLLLLPLRWVMGALLAALVHEIFHCIAIHISGGHVLSLSLGAFGAKIEASSMTSGRESFCALAGPVGSFSMLLVTECFPEAALCGLIQGAYNLLPLYPLDGGRLINCLLPEPVCLGIRVFTLVVLSGLGLWILTYIPEIGAVLLLSVWIPVAGRKFPCKAGRLAVQ